VRLVYFCNKQRKIDQQKWWILNNKNRKRFDLGCKHRCYDMINEVRMEWSLKSDIYPIKPYNQILGNNIILKFFIVLKFVLKWF